MLHVFTTRNNPCSHSPGPDVSNFDLGSTQGSIIAFRHLEEALSAAGVSLDPEVEAIVRKVTNEAEIKAGSRRNSDTKPASANEAVEESAAEGTSQSKTGIPEHLRPSSIKIRGPSDGGSDESTPGQIAEILNLLRSNTHKNQMLKQVAGDLKC